MRNSKNRSTVIITDPVHPLMVELLALDYDVSTIKPEMESEWLRYAEKADVLIVRSKYQFDATALSSCKHLRLIARAGNGVDNIDIQAARARGITVFNVPSISANCVAEFTVGLLLSTMRNICIADRQTRSGQWKKSELVGSSLRGKTLGIVGVGEIGTRVALMAINGFGMNVVAASSSRTGTICLPSGAAEVEVLPLKELLSRSDVVSIHVPLMDSTRGLMAADEFGSMKKGSFIINMSRAGVIDESALYDALLSGHLRGAATDVSSNEGANIPMYSGNNLITTPHIGAMTEDSQREIAIAIVSNIKKFFCNELVANRIC